MDAAVPPPTLTEPSTERRVAIACLVAFFWPESNSCDHLPELRTHRALERSQDGRVVWVASGGMYTQRLQIDDPKWKKRSYDGVIANAETKHAQVVLAELCAEKLAGHLGRGGLDAPGLGRHARRALVDARLLARSRPRTGSRVRGDASPVA